MNEMLEFILTDAEILSKFLKTKLNELNKMEPLDKKEEKLPDKAGIYVFYENKDKAIYVGRTDNIRQRIQFHIRPSSGRDTATFAFLLAKKEYEDKFPESKKLTRKKLEEKEDFKPIFNSKKDYLNSEKISYRYLLVENDIFQTILEPYIAYNLGTYPFSNTFKNH